MAAKKKAKVGRKPNCLVTPKVLNLVRKYSRQGMTKEQIAGCLGWSVATYMLRQTEFPELSEVFEQGRSKGIADVSGKAISMAMKGNDAMVRFFLARRASWEERTKHELSNDPANPMPQTHHTVLILPTNGREAKKDGKD